MSATNMTIATPKPCMYYDCTYPFTGLKKPTAVNTDDILKKQYNYSKAFISHGERIEETVDPDTVEHTKYSGVIISHGETIEDIPETPIKKKYMWTSFVDFFKQRQKFQRYPFLHTPNI